jgi:hypothetical protein
MKRISVLSQGGKLIGIYVPPGPAADPKAPLARLVAGPKQKLHEIALELPARLESHREVEAFHAIVRKRLKLRK